MAAIAGASELTAGVQIQLTGDALRRLRKISAGLANKPAFFSGASELMLDQTQQRFKEQRGPDGGAWKGLAPSTVRSRGSSSPILQDSGSLRGGLHASASSAAAVVTAPPLIYAAIHQMGGQAGRGRSVTIPARPYLGFGGEDVREITELAEEMMGWR